MNEQRGRNDGRYLWMIVLQSVLYGVLDPVAKWVYVEVPTYTFLLLRYTLALLLLAPFGMRGVLKEIRSRPIREYILPTVCMGAAFIVSNLALNDTLAATVSFVRSVSALVVPLLMFLFFKKRLKKAEYLLFAMILAGSYLLCMRNGAPSFGLGEALALAAETLVAESLAFGQSALQTICP